MEKTKNIKELEHLIDLAKAVKSLEIKKDKQSITARDADLKNTSPKKIDKLTSNLNWTCMDLDKAKTTFARTFKGSILDVSTDKKEYNPSGFHSYKH